MIVACQNNKHLVTTLLSPHLPRCWLTHPPSLNTDFTETFHFLPLYVLTCTLTQFNNTYTQHSHWGSSTYPQMWHLLVTLYLANSCIHTTLLHREPCCVLSGGTQMAATWCVLMGSCNGFGQDMDTHTQMATHWEWLGDGRADYWFAQINDSQPGHLTLRELHPLSWHIGLAHWAHITASMQDKSQLSLTQIVISVNILKALDKCFLFFYFIFLAFILPSCHSYMYVVFF